MAKARIYCKLKETSVTVEKILTEKPATREDDYLLFSYYLNTKGISVKTSFRTIHQLIKGGEIPSIESVSRVRRCIQEKRPELQAENHVVAARKEMTEGYIEYVKKT